MSIKKNTMNKSKQKKLDESTVRNRTLSQSFFQGPRKAMLIWYLPIGLGISITLLFIAYHFQILKFPQEISANAPQQTTSIVKVSPAIQQEKALTDKVKYSELSEAQMQYYKAIKLLNQGNEEQAVTVLKSILEKYPDFLPAKESYTMIVER